jgi:Ser/Thr protein kinase RdoA (MazF antagonist)
VAAFVGAHYDLPEPLECILLQRGFNDSFAIRTPDQTRYVLRVSGRRRRGDADVDAETRFLAYLDSARVPVASAVPTRSGALFCKAALAEGFRPAVLFRYADGRVPGLDAPEDARVQGITLARIHTAAEKFPDPEAGRYRLDLDHLLHRPVAAVAELKDLTEKTQRYLSELSSRLNASVSALQDLSWTRCHGDCHGFNARIITDGPQTGQARFFDFDDGGFGYLAYDLAVHLWAQTSFQRRRHAIWLAFIDGYRSVRPIAPQDFDAVALFVPIRHIWLMGEYAGRVTEWGTETMVWLDKQEDFLISSTIAQAQRTPRAGPSKVARKPSPVVFTSRPRKRSRLRRIAA